MPHSRKRHLPHNQQKASALQAKKNNKASIVCAALFAIFAFVFAAFAGAGYIGMCLGIIAGAFIGYALGKSIDKDAKTQ